MRRYAALGSTTPRLARPRRMLPEMHLRRLPQYPARPRPAAVLCCAVRCGAVTQGAARGACRGDVFARGQDGPSHCAERNCSRRYLDGTARAADRLACQIECHRDIDASVVSCKSTDLLGPVSNPRARGCDSRTLSVAVAVHPGRVADRITLTARRGAGRGGDSEWARCAELRPRKWLVSLIWSAVRRVLCVWCPILQDSDKTR